MEVSVDGVVKTLTVDYTLSGVGDDAGGNVTMLAAPATSTSVVRRRNMALTRNTDYQDQGKLPASTLDSDLDSAVLMIQQVGEQIGRALTLPAGIVGISAELPGPVPTNLLGWSEDGSKIRNYTLEEAGVTPASSIPYTPAGAGAVTTTVQAKLRESVSVKDFGVVADGVTDDTTSFTSALAAASGTIGGQQGATLFLPQGTTMLSSQKNIPNRVNIQGANKRGTFLRATPGHTGPYMLTAVNGTGSMFDNSLKDLTVDCKDVAGLGGVISDAWQEGGGMRDVLLYNFTTYGVRFRNGFGGASLCEISQSEIFGSAVTTPVVGIQVDQISAVGAFMLKVRDTTIAGATIPKSLPIGINMVNDSLHCQNVHFEYCTSGIYLQGVGHHVLIGVTGGPGVTNVVEVSSTFTGTLSMIGCHRAGATNLLVDNRPNGYGVISSIDTDITINPQPSFGPGMTNSCGVFDGTALTAATSFGVSNISRAAAGDYTVTEIWSRSTINAAVTASSNLASGHTTVDLLSATQYRIRIYNASNVLADANEVKFICQRIT